MNHAIDFQYHYNEHNIAILYERIYDLFLDECCEKNEGMIGLNDDEVKGNIWKT